MKAHLPRNIQRLLFLIFLLTLLILSAEIPVAVAVSITATALRRNSGKIGLTSPELPFDFNPKASERYGEIEESIQNAIDHPGDHPETPVAFALTKWANAHGVSLSGINLEQRRLVTDYLTREITSQSFDGQEGECAVVTYLNTHTQNVRQNFNEKVFFASDLVMVHPDGSVGAPHPRLFDRYFPEITPLMLRSNDMDSAETTRERVVEYLESCRAHISMYATEVASVFILMKNDLLSMYLLEYFFHQLSQANAHSAIPLFSQGFNVFEDKMCGEIKQPPKEVLMAIMSQHQALLTTHGAFDLQTSTAKRIADKYYKMLLAEARRIIGSDSIIKKFYPELRLKDAVQLDTLTLALEHTLKDNLNRALKNPDKTVQAVQDMFAARTLQQRTLTATLQENFAKILAAVDSTAYGKTLLQSAASVMANYDSAALIIADSSHIGGIREAVFQVTVNGAYAARSRMMVIAGLEIPNDPMLIAQPPAANTLGDLGKVYLKQVFEDELLHLVAAAVTDKPGTPQLGDMLIYPFPSDELTMKKAFFAAAEIDALNVEQLGDPRSALYIQASNLLKSYLTQLESSSRDRYISLALTPDTPLLAQLIKTQGQEVQIPFTDKLKLKGYVRGIKKMADCSGTHMVTVSFQVTRDPVNKLVHSIQMQILATQAQAHLFQNYPIEKRSIEMLNKLGGMIDRYGLEITQLLFPSLTNYFFKTFLPLVEQHNQQVFWDNLSSQVPREEPAPPYGQTIGMMPQ